MERPHERNAFFFLALKFMKYKCWLGLHLEGQTFNYSQQHQASINTMNKQTDFRPTVGGWIQLIEKKLMKKYF